MTESEEMYPSVVKWCFDRQRRPVCPSLWDERVEADDCDLSICPYSHEVEPLYLQGECQLPLALLDEEADIQEVANYLATHSLIDEPPAEAQREAEEAAASQQDEDYVREMLEEMRKFEEAKVESEELPSSSHKPCRYFVETGNCLRRADCPHAHGATDSPEDVVGRWYPNWQDCACCQGFIYKCAKEACAKQGSCVTCQSISE